MTHDDAVEQVQALVKALRNRLDVYSEVRFCAALAGHAADWWAEMSHHADMLTADELPGEAARG